MITRIILLFLIVTSLSAETSRTVPPEPSWQIKLDNVAMPKELLELPPNNRSSSLAQWDEDHIIVSYLLATKHLATRAPLTEREGTRAFSVNIIRTANGKTEKSAILPAGGTQSELAVVTGGLVLSDPGRLRFFSRTLESVGPAFAFKSLNGPSSWDIRYDPEHLIVSEDRKLFVLVNTAGHRSHFFLFDGATFEKKRDWIVPDVSWETVSFRNGRLYFEDIDTASISWATLDGNYGRLGSSSDSPLCRTSIPGSSDSFFDHCGRVSLIGQDGRKEFLYQPRKAETVLLSTVSADGHWAAALDLTIKGGGMFDTTEHISAVSLLLFELNGSRRFCRIPFISIPRTQLAFTFAQDSSLVILNDASLMRYTDLCVR